MHDDRQAGVDDPHHLSGLKIIFLRAHGHEHRIAVEPLVQDDACVFHAGPEVAPPDRPPRIGAIGQNGRLFRADEIVRINVGQVGLERRHRKVWCIAHALEQPCDVWRRPHHVGVGRVLEAFGHDTGHLHCRQIEVANDLRRAARLHPGFRSLQQRAGDFGIVRAIEESELAAARAMSAVRGVVDRGDDAADGPAIAVRGEQLERAATVSRQGVALRVEETIEIRPHGRYVRRCRIIRIERNVEGGAPVARAEFDHEAAARLKISSPIRCAAAISLSARISDEICGSEKMASRIGCCDSRITCVAS